MSSRNKNCLRLTTGSLITLLLLSFLLPIPPCYGQKAAVDDLVVSNSKEDLLVFFTVKDAFSNEMIEAVKNGLPVTFTFQLQLYEINSGWPDSRIVDVSIDHILRYDGLKEEYTMTDDGEGGRTQTVGKLQEALRIMSEINGYRLLSLKRLRPGGDYRLRVKALLAKKELPFKMHYLIPFYSLWGFETDWYELSFRY